MTEQAQYIAGETTDFQREDTVSQMGIDCAEFLIESVKKSPHLKLDEQTLKDVAASTLSSLTLYVEDVDSPFQEDKEQ